MTGLVARAVIPAPIQAAWGIAKPLLPYIGAALAVLAAYWWADDRGRAAQREKDAKAIAAITQQRDSWVAAFHLSDANFHTAIGMVNDQTARIRALKADGDARARQAVAERDAAIKANRSLTAQAVALRDSAKRHYSSAEPCTTSATLLNAKDL